MGLKSNKSEALSWTGIGLFVIFVLAFITWSEVNIRQERAAELVVRKEICANVCAKRDSNRAGVYKQRLGWGASEWRCGCLDGHVQVIP